MRRRILLVGLLALSACGVPQTGSAGTVADTSDSNSASDAAGTTSLTATNGYAATGTWTCPDDAPSTTVVHQYSHVPAQVGPAFMPGGGTALLCGTPGYGFRHILMRHQGDWQHVGTGDWSALADGAVALALGQPERVGYRMSNQTFCYSHTLPDGEVTTVVIRPSDGAIITAYPGTHQCDEGATAGGE